MGFEMYDPRAPFFRAPRAVMPVVHYLTVSVHAGEVLAVVGASGSGKSVLADALMGAQYEPNALVSGTIWFEGARMDAGRILPRCAATASPPRPPQSVANLDPLMRVGTQMVGPCGHGRAGSGTPRGAGAPACASSWPPTGSHPIVADLYPARALGRHGAPGASSSARSWRTRALIIADEPTPGLDLDLAVRALDDLRAFADAGGGVHAHHPRYRARPARGRPHRGLSRGDHRGGDGVRELRLARAPAAPVLARALARAARSARLLRWRT